MDDRFDRAVAAVDAANADDPNTIMVRGVERPKEQAHAELMTEWVVRLDPGAEVAQLLAARAHHLRRWALPRSSYPDGRAGYLRWRLALRDRHGVEVAELLKGVGYEPVMAERVRSIVRKEHLRTDPAVQTHEDALCLVFLETQFDALTEQLGDDKTVDVVRKTLAKMSPAAIQAALALTLSESGRSIVEQAAAQP